MARLDPDRTLRQRDAGTIVAFKQLTPLAPTRYPGDRQRGIDRDLELDAVSGQVLKDHQDS
nr:hypothetical protein [Pseudomonas sp. R37(2017)]